MRRTRPALAALAALLAAGCSHHGSTTPRPAVDLKQASPFEDAVIADGATSLFPLRDADGLRARDQVSDIAGDKLPATVVGGSVLGTTSPSGAGAALFQRDGRIVTKVDQGLSSTDAFSVETAFRVDACTTAWGRMLGTSAFNSQGREGLDVLHFPSVFQLSACKVAVELWHAGRYVGGCHPAGVPATGTWIHFVLTYSARRISCFENGRLAGSELLPVGASFAQPAALGIGGSGSGYQGPADGVSLSEVAVYAKPLTPAQVLAHAQLLDKPLTAETVAASPRPS